MCKLCNTNYIASTDRQLPCRFAELMDISVTTNSLLSTTPNSSIYNHESETGHIMDKLTLRTVEALHIVKGKPELNCGLPVELSLLY